jgi:hypothetical protein
MEARRLLPVVLRLDPQIKGKTNTDMNRRKHTSMKADERISVKQH